MDDVPIAQAPTRFLSVKEIEELSTFCRHTIAAKVRRGEFPPPVKLTDGPKGRIGWPLEDWEKWVIQRRLSSRHG